MAYRAQNIRSLEYRDYLVFIGRRDSRRVFRSAGGAEYTVEEGDQPVLANRGRRGGGGGGGGCDGAGVAAQLETKLGVVLLVVLTP